MAVKTQLKSAIAAAVLTLTVAAQVHAETAFGTLAGIEAEPMSAVEMERPKASAAGPWRASAARPSAPA